MTHRVIAAFAVFVAVATSLMVCLTSVALGVLWALAGFRDSLGLGMAVAVYSPLVAPFLVISVAVALWASRRTYFR